MSVELNSNLASNLFSNIRTSPKNLNETSEFNEILEQTQSENSAQIEKNEKGHYKGRIDLMKESFTRLNYEVVTSALGKLGDMGGNKISVEEVLSRLHPNDLIDFFSSKLNISKDALEYGLQRIELKVYREGENAFIDYELIISQNHNEIDKEKLMIKEKIINQVVDKFIKTFLENKANESPMQGLQARQKFIDFLPNNEFSSSKADENIARVLKQI